MSIHDNVAQPSTAGRRRSSFAKVAGKVLHPFRTSSELSRSRSNSPASSRTNSQVEEHADKESKRLVTFPRPGDATFPTTEEGLETLKAKLQAREVLRRGTRDEEIKALGDAEQAAFEREQERRRHNEYLLRRDAFLETAEELIPQLKDMDDGEKHDRVKAFREIEKAEAARQETLKNKEKIRRESFDKKRVARIAQFRLQMEGSIKHSLEKPARK